MGFKWLYHKRWCIETYFDRLKNLLDIERFSSKSVHGIEQEFHALIFLSNFESILVKEDNKIIYDENLKKKLKWEYRINKSVSYSTIANFIVDLLLNTDVPTWKVLAKLSEKFKVGLSPVRPGRQYKRKETNSTRE